MKRLLAAVCFCATLCGCIHSWVGRPVAQLERELGRPRNIQNEGIYRVYVYPDPLAPGQQMRFWIDSRGTIQEWTASAEVPGVFSETIGGELQTPGNFPTTP